MKEIPIIIRFGGAHGRSRQIKKEISRKIYKGAADALITGSGFMKDGKRISPSKIFK